MVIFKTLKYRNFLSCGNQWIEIELNKAPKTIIVGDNGHGKSTVISALTFALFGKDFRGINKPALVNSINKKGLEVEVTFETRGKEYRIRRGVAPSIFEVYMDGNLINQTAYARDYQKYVEENVLKLNYGSFIQIVVLGTNNFIPFMQLRAHDRRGIIEDLLDITVFSKMNMILKNQMNETKEILQEIENKISVEKQKLQIVKEHLLQLAKANEQKITHAQEEINKHRELIDEKMFIIETLTARKDAFQNKISEIQEKLSRKQTLENELSSAEDNITSLEAKLRFLEQTDECPTCRQEIDEMFKLQQEDEFNKRLAEVKFEHQTYHETLSKLRLLEEKNNLITGEYSNILQQLTDAQSSVHVAQQYIQKIESDLKSIGQIDKEAIKEQKQKLKDHVQLIDEYRQSKITESTKRELENIAYMLLKDNGIKTKIIQSYIPYMNTLINGYLNDMDFYVQFELDENFKEVIRSRYRDDFSYENFSAGEKQRIDLAILFAWREIARKKNSMAVNILFMDETLDSSMDTNGVDDLMKILYTLKGMNVFIISHKENMADKFDRVLKFEKKNNFSTVREL